MRRVLIVDFNHLAHIYFNSPQNLSIVRRVNGESVRIPTKVQNGVLKSIYKWSNKGRNPTAVCFDKPVPARKIYFSRAFDMPLNTDKEYKGGRKSMPQTMYDAMESTRNALIEGGVSCYMGDNYEADDLIFACVEVAKREYPGLPIDVVTNDADLLPLVDDTVSVFLRSRKTTWAECDEIEKAHYVQVTPENYKEIIEDLSAFDKFYMPYNTVLFHKLVRGDSSDRITGIKKAFPPRVYNKLIHDLEENGVDISNLFRYGKCQKIYLSKSTGEEVAYDPDKFDDMVVTYKDPEELYMLIDTLCWYIEDEEVLTYIRKKYRGMNLNQAYLGYGEFSRKPAEPKAMSGFDEIRLGSIARDRFEINLIH